VGRRGSKDLQWTAFALGSWTLDSGLRRLAGASLQLPPPPPVYPLRR